MSPYPTIESIMTANPVTITKDDNVAEIIAKLEQHKFSHLPVVDDEKTLLGIISNADLYAKVLSIVHSTNGQTYTDKVLKATTIEEIMTTNPVVVTMNHPIDHAVELLLQGDFHALPVVEEKKLVGILTSKNMLEYIVKYRENKRKK